MITPTYFGEITELNSRAVWYSDEEDEEEDEDIGGPGMKLVEVSPIKDIETISHDSIKASVQAFFDAILWDTSAPYSRCIVSLSSEAKFRHFKLGPTTKLKPVGHLGPFGKAFSAEIQLEDQSDNPERLLWLLFDGSSCYTNGYQACYLAECLLDALFIKFKLTKSSHLIILSRQYSTGQNVEYLNNYSHPSMKIPVVGKPMLPPHLIRYQFESALFEQSTLLLNPALVICVPDPKTYWFDFHSDCPSIPDEIIILKLIDDHLEQTLIFT